MGNFEKLSVLVIVVIIVMILVVAIYEWTGSPSEATPADGPTTAATAEPTPSPSSLLPTPTPTPARTPTPAPGTRTPAGPLAASSAGSSSDPLEDWWKKPLIEPAGAEPAATDKPEPTPEPVVAPKPSATEIAETTHVVAAGEMLSEISKKHYGKSSLWPRILEANPGVDERRLREGMKLKIPALKIEAPASADASSGPALAMSGERPVPGKEYKVKASDSWERISKAAFNTTDRWPEIYMKNMKLTPSPKDLRGDLVIMIPK